MAFSKTSAFSNGTFSVECVEVWARKVVQTAFPSALNYLTDLPLFPQQLQPCFDLMGIHNSCKPKIVVFAPSAPFFLKFVAISVLKGVDFASSHSRLCCSPENITIEAE